MLSVIVVPYACRGAELAKFIGEFWGRSLTLYNRPTRVNVQRSVRWIDLTVVGDITSQIIAEKQGEEQQQKSRMPTITYRPGG
jgi:hypothetical protein